MSDDKPTIDVPNNVVVVAFGNETKVRRDIDRRHCHHFQIEVDQERRAVRCLSCDAMLDAFEVLLQYANKERHFHHWEQATRETQAKLERLKEEEKRVKARTRAASRKDAATAVAEDRRRDGLRKQAVREIACSLKLHAERLERLTRGGQVHDPEHHRG